MKIKLNIEFQQIKNIWIPICDQCGLVGYSGNSLDEVRKRSIDALRFAFEPVELEFTELIKFENSSASA